MTTLVPHIALVGRPNVGKSTLFNRLLGKRQAVVSDIPGTTRDRLQQLTRVMGKEVFLVDMAGIEPALQDPNEISAGMQQQVERALADASVIIWVVDRVTGVTQQDEKVAELLRRLHKPVIVAVNKCDDADHELMQYEFMRYGFEPLVPISAMHNRGIVVLQAAIATALPEASVTPLLNPQDLEDRELRIAILGRPNVGKSTLINALAEESRAVVSPIAGTTRDAVDTVLTAEQVFGKTFTRFQSVRVVDTAGIRRRGKIGHEIEAWSVLRSLDSLDRAQVVLFVIDAVEHLTHGDLTVVERILKSGRPLILVVNKWDAWLEQNNIFAGTPEDEVARERFQAQVLSRAPFMTWVQLIFLSAKTGLNLNYLGRLMLRAYEAWSKNIGQQELNTLVTELKKNPRLRSLKRIEFQRSQPPIFILHVSGQILPHFTVRRFVENALRDYFDLGPTPVKLWVECSGKRRRISTASAQPD